jgi:hypothetical protein
MGLFGPLSSTAYSGYALAGAAPLVYRGDYPGNYPGANRGANAPQQDDSDYALQIGMPRPLPPAALPYGVQPYQQSAAAGAPPPGLSPPANPLAPAPRISTPPPYMQVLGGFTTRRTQLFGPLSGVSV